MKKLSLLFAVLFVAFYMNAQNVAINNDGSTAASSAMLDVKSTTKGFMMPRLTSAQRTTIASPALGLLVFDTDTKTIWAYDGANWKNLSIGGGLSLPFNQTINQAGSAFSITNTGNAITGVSSTNQSALIGSNTNTGTGGIGVLGSASNVSGIGVSGQTADGTGVMGLSTNGVGVKAISANGLALQVFGDLKISGGNTNPGDGKILSSDASGNAVWKPNKIAFSAFTINSAHTALASGELNKLVFSYKQYDFGNNFSAYELSGTPPPDASVFTAPVEGIYHFDAAVYMSFDGGYTVESFIHLIIERGGQTWSLKSLPGILVPDIFTTTLDPVQDTKLDFGVGGDFLLFPGDKVCVKIKQRNLPLLQTPGTGTLSTSSGSFTGHLVVATN